MNKIEPRLLKGFRDYGAEVQLPRQAMLEKIQTVFGRFGFLPLATPVLEYKEILLGKYGEDEKLVYNFLDNGLREVAMRYDLTVPLARYVAQNQGQLSFPFKRFQIAPVWRADNPQKGRLREFYQADIDVVGSEAALADAEVIACLCQALAAIGVTDYEVRFNSRKVFELLMNSPAEDLQQKIEIIRAVDKVQKIGKDAVMDMLVQKNIAPGLISKVKLMLDWQPGLDALTELSKLSDEAAAVAQSLQELIDLVSSQGVPAEQLIFDPLVARGLDYYTGIVFEIMLRDRPEFGSIAGGGRYDNLLEQFSGQTQSCPAVGGSIGIDRLFEALQDAGRLIQINPITAIIFNLDESLQKDYLNLATKLRSAGINIELYYQPTKIDKQFKYAESKRIGYAIIFGRNEQDHGIVQLKNLQTREQIELKQDDLIQQLEKL